MISDVKQTIINKLAGLYPAAEGYTIYDEDIPQNFKTPSFFITLIEQTYNKRINVKFKGLLSFDVAFFSDKEVTEVKTDCLDVQQALFREFDLIGAYRIINKQGSITDNVLHFTFDVSYSEINLTPETKMQQQQTNMSL